MVQLEIIPKAIERARQSELQAIHNDLTGPGDPIPPNKNLGEISG